MIMVGTGDLSAAQTTGNVGLDALGAQLHGTLHGHLHGAAVRDALFQLGGDVLGHQLSVQIGRADFNDGDGNGLADHLRDSLLQLLDLGAALAHDHAGLGAVDEDADLGAVALDLDLGDASLIQVGLQIFTDLVVLHQQVADEFVFGKPTGVPTIDNAHAQTVGIDFLAHSFPPDLFFLGENHVDVAGSLLDTGGAAAGPGHHPLQDGAGAAVDLGDIQLFGIHFEIVFRIGGAALQQLHQRLAGGLAGVHQDGGGGGHVLAADQVADDLDLTGRHTNKLDRCFGFHFRTSHYLPVLLPA